MNLRKCINIRSACTGIIAMFVYLSGNQYTHLLTNNGSMWKIKIEFLTETNVWKQVVYDSFSIGPESDEYRLHVSGYNPTSSTAGNT